MDNRTTRSHAGRYVAEKGHHTYHNMLRDQCGTAGHERQ